MATEDQQEEHHYSQDFLVRRFLIKNVLSVSIFVVLVVTIWTVLGFFLPDGWWHIVINIGAILFTLFWGWVVTPSFRQLRLPVPALIAVVWWFVLVLVLRTIEGAILDSVF